MNKGIIDGNIILTGESVPSGAIIDQILNLKFGGPIEKWLETTLLIPVSDIMNRPSKRFRANLVRLGCLLTSQNAELTSSEQELCLQFGELVELLHAGSLVVDDIEDQSTVRRGQPSLHIKYGTSLALNAGNFLYFWPMMLIDAMRLSPTKELWVRRYIQYMMVRAHCGQALDSGIAIDRLPQEEVFGLCLSSMELKTGALFALALSLGSVAAESSVDPIPDLSEFGHGFGIALQMFNDIGNLQGQGEPEKQYEDLINRRPCWVWAFIAKRSSKNVYQAFIEAVNLLPDDTPLQEWLAKYDVLKGARLEALDYLENVHKKCKDSLGPNHHIKAAVLNQLYVLGQQISSCYC